MFLKVWFVVLNTKKSNGNAIHSENFNQIALQFTNPLKVTVLYILLH